MDSVPHKYDVKYCCILEIEDAYLFTWLAGIFSFCMCRSLAVMYANCSYIPFYLSIALAINKYIRIRQRKKKEVRD